MCDIKFYTIFLLSALTIHCAYAEDDSLHYLPNNSYPLKYDLWLKVGLENDSSFFEGNVKIHVKIQEVSDNITIHAKNLRIKKIDLTDLSTTIKHENLNYQFETSLDFLFIQLPFTVLQDQQILLDISYDGNMLQTLNETFSSKGCMIGRYQDGNQSLINESYIFTEFESSNARTCFPCFDEPSMKSYFNLQIEHDSSYNAIANMPVISRVQANQTNYVITTFQESPKMPTYLLAFVVSKFKYIESNDVDNPQRIYARSSLIDQGKLDFIIIHVDRILRTFEEYFKIPYSLPKLDHVVGPNFTSATENWGIIGYPERYLFKSENDAFIFLLHEIAHHYFGNLVTPKFWSYVWLKEGLAQHYEIEIGKLAFPEKSKEIEQYRERRIPRTRHTDSKSDTKPLNYHKQTSEDMGSFLHFMYLKGESIVRMFQAAIGEETWRKGMNYFINDNMYSSVEPKDLHIAVQKALDEDFPNNSINIEKAMSTWEDQAGLPTITVNLENGTLKLSQKRKVRFSSKFPWPEIYSIPIFYISSSNPSCDHQKANFWMIEKEMEIKNFADEWIILNCHNIGYYKVEYDLNTWKGVIEQLSRNHSLIEKSSMKDYFDSLFDNYDLSNCDDYFPILRLLRRFDDDLYPKENFFKRLNGCMKQI